MLSDWRNFMIEKVVSEFISSNVFVVFDGDYCFIVDAGAKKEEVEKVIAGKKVEGILLTHGHYDHCLRVLEYAKSFGAKVYASEFIKEYLGDGEKNYSEGKFSIQDFSNFNFLSGEGKLKLPHFEIAFKQLGGHSKSDMLYCHGDDIFVGDVVIGRDMGRIDLYGSDKDEMEKSLAYLKALNYLTMHSGHGEDNDKKTQDKVVSLWLRFLTR